MRPDLKPRSLFRVLDQAFELYRANFKTIALSVAMIIFPMALLMSLAQVFYYRGIFEAVLEGVANTSAQGDPTAMFEGLMGLSIFSAVVQAIGPLYWFAIVYLSTCLYASGPRMLAGERPGVKEFLTPGINRVFWVGLTTFVVTVISSVAAIFLIIPGIIAYLALSVAAVTSVVEQVTLPTALSRSWALTRRSWWRILGFWMVLVTLVSLLQAAVQSPSIIRQLLVSISDPMAVFQSVPPAWKTVEGVFSALAASLVLPFTQLAWFALYLDLRARREGMDIVARAMDIAGDDR